MGRARRWNNNTEVPNGPMTLYRSLEEEEDDDDDDDDDDIVMSSKPKPKPKPKPKLKPKPKPKPKPKLKPKSIDKESKKKSKNKKSDKEEYGIPVVTMNANQYINEMAKDRTWGTEAEILRYSWRRPVVAFCEDPATGRVIQTFVNGVAYGGNSPQYRAALLNGQTVYLHNSGNHFSQVSKNP